jgi:hypothetical protein
MVIQVIIGDGSIAMSVIEGSFLGVSRAGGVHVRLDRSISGSGQPSDASWGRGYTPHLVSLLEIREYLGSFLDAVRILVGMIHQLVA